MLILSRKIEEAIVIGDNIEIKILDVFASDASESKKSKAVSIGISAPRDIRIVRKELLQTAEENLEASKSVQVVSAEIMSEMLRKKREIASGK
ncbi:carbon storage regulator [Oscillospiraceae bacterium MB08-C2-2]|nr:carbon storage regulator [Oscillospiraceae bacterium MB08-C2-2]